MTASDTPLTSDFGGRERYDGATTTDGPGQSRQRLGTPDLAPTYMEVDMDSARPDPLGDEREPDAWVDGQPVYYPPGFADAWAKLAAGVAAGKSSDELRPEFAAVNRTIDRQRQIDALTAWFDGPDCEVTR